MLRSVDDAYKTLFKRTKISAELLFYPLTFGPIFGAGGGDLWASSGIWRYVKEVNGGSHYYGYQEEFGSDYKFIFGDVMNDPEAGEDAGVILLKKLNKAEAKREELSRIFDIFIEVFSALNSRTVSENDEAAFIRSIGDVRVQGKFWNIEYILSKASGEEKKRMAKAVIDRILMASLSENGQEGDVKSLLSPLSWAASEVAPTQEQLEKLHNNPELERFVHAGLRKIVRDAPEEKKADRISYMVKWVFTEYSE